MNLLFAVILDAIIGDPYNFPHPVKLMGKIINIEEEIVRKIFKKKTGLQIGGLFMVVINIFIAAFFSYLVVNFTSGWVNNILKIVIYYYCISAKNLDFEANNVKLAIVESIEKGRERLKYIVGRDTENLDLQGIIKATVETVSENTSDGVIAPLFYITLFGPYGGLIYKFINTMDSMLGYKNEKYIDLGRFPAITDDIANFIPARLTALLMAISAVHPTIVFRSLKTIKKYGRKHTSPNSGYPESAIAGILGVELGGGSYYDKKFVDKPKIGDNIRELDLNDIDSTISIMYRTEILYMIIVFIIEYINAFCI